MQASWDENELDEPIWWTVVEGSLGLDGGTSTVDAELQGFQQALRAVISYATLGYITFNEYQVSYSM